MAHTIGFGSLCGLDRRRIEACCDPVPGSADRRIHDHSPDNAARVGQADVRTSAPWSSEVRPAL